MSDYVPPEEIMVEILKRLPVESLLRFRCVNKSWYSLITSPHFIYEHLNTKISNNDTYLLIRHAPRLYKNPIETYSLYPHDHTQLDPVASFTLPVNSFESYFNVVGSVNGLLCLSDDVSSYNESVVLWNPSIRRHMVLPTANFVYANIGPYQHAIGFGFTPSTHDYKIVRIVHTISLHVDVQPLVEVYQLSTGVWRSIDVGDFSYIVLERNRHAFFNGSAHWLGRKGGCDRGSNEYGKIVTFNMVTEELGLMNVPDDVDPWSSRVAVCGGSLSLLYHVTQSFFDDICYVLAMKEYGKEESWTKLYSVNLQKENLSIAFGFRGIGEVLMATKRRDFGFYDPETRQTRTLGITGCKESVYGDTYVESLVLVHLKENIGDLAVCKGTSSDAEFSSFDESFDMQDIMQFLV